MRSAEFSAFSASFVAAIVGFGGTLALVLAAAEAVGANQAQTASWVTAICVAIALSALILSWRYKMPIMTAWSAAGLALIGGTNGFNMEEAVGAFVICGVLLTATGLFKPLASAVERIPRSISAGMLAGVLLPFVTNGALAAGVDPTFVLPLVALFLVLRLFNPSLAVIAILIVGIVWAVGAGKTTGAFQAELSRLVFVAPEFSLAALFGLAIPLYLVTMASQNLTGLAVLRADGYDPPAGAAIGLTGAFSVVIAFLGSSCANISAITAAICTGPHAHPDPTKRWHTGVWYFIFYMVFAAFGASMIGLIAIMPPVLITLVMALALIAPLANSATIALQDEEDRFAAISTLAATASGVSFFGIGSAFWGLMFGLVIHFLVRKSG